jgi:hypothetical protein
MPAIIEAGPANTTLSEIMSVFRKVFCEYVETAVF